MRLFANQEKWMLVYYTGGNTLFVHKMRWIDSRYAKWQIPNFIWSLREMCIRSALLFHLSYIKKKRRGQKEQQNNQSRMNAAMNALWSVIRNIF